MSNSLQVAVNIHVVRHWPVTQVPSIESVPLLYAIIEDLW